MDLKQQKTLVFINFEQLVSVSDDFSTSQNPLGVIANGVLVIENGKIAWLGNAEDWDNAFYPDATYIEGRGKILLPGFVDSHTHPVFAGNRADEFERRLEGVSYQEIAEQGGGIQKTVKATREASEETLFQKAQKHLMEMLSFGVTTVEAKSGYGLTWESELKSLQVIARLDKTLPMSVVPTFMGAHDIPVEFRGNPEAYLHELCEVQIPQVAQRNLAVFCDVFCEQGYFDIPQTRKILETARSHGLKLKVHAEEFCHLGGAELAGELNATSADHLLHISDPGMLALKQGGTVACLLPGTAYYLRIKDYAPARSLIAAGVPVALATDFNPGSCMCNNLQWMMSLACQQMNMTPAEVIRGVTLNGAMALDLHHDRGSLSVGKRGDVLVFDATSYNDLLYQFGVNHLESVYCQGQLVYSPSKQVALAAG
ncbi:MAG: imidazolonepropionase [Cyanobacteria bacterium]|nr:imidazolonepropionase [Cyanobacteriota bacterium]